MKKNILGKELTKAMKTERGKSLRQFCVENNLEIIIDQFDETLNFPDTVDTVSAKTDKKYYFTYNCAKQHTKLQRVADKTGKKSVRCPLCQNRGAVGRSIADEYPNTYAKMFDERKNGIKASEVPVRSGKKYWWNCLTCGNAFQGKVSCVTNGKRVCQECNNKKQSDAERILAYYLKKLDDARIINYKIEKWKYDFYLPKYNLIIEYDGYPWHDRERACVNDITKDSLAIANGYRICRLRDKRLKKNYKLQAIQWIFEYDYSYKYFEAFPLFMSSLIGDDALLLDINVTRDSKEIHVHHVTECKRKSLLYTKPELEIYIDKDDERNGNPEYVYMQSHSLFFYMKHPDYPALKWVYSAHELFAKKREPIPQAINMCVKVIKYYPEVEKEVVEISMNMRENTIIHKKCDSCGIEMELKYTQLYYSKGKKKRCPDCLKAYRLSNLS